MAEVVEGARVKQLGHRRRRRRAAAEEEEEELADSLMVATTARSPNLPPVATEELADSLMVAATARSPNLPPVATEELALPSAALREGPRAPRAGFSTAAAIKPRLAAKK